MQCMQVHMGQGKIGGPTSRGGTFNLNRGTNIEPCMGPALD